MDDVSTLEQLSNSSHELYPPRLHPEGRARISRQIEIDLWNLAAPSPCYHTAGLGPVFKSTELKARFPKCQYCAVTLGLGADARAQTKAG